MNNLQKSGERFGGDGGRAAKRRGEFQRGNTSTSYSDESYGHVLKELVYVCSSLRTCKVTAHIQILAELLLVTVDICLRLLRSSAPPFLHSSTPPLLHSYTPPVPLSFCPLLSFLSAPPRLPAYRLVTITSLPGAHILISMLHAFADASNVSNKTIKEQNKNENENGNGNEKKIQNRTKIIISITIAKSKL